ncbi:MAG: LysM domain-containing protein, partial [Anaerolineae bacterium]
MTVAPGDTLFTLAQKHNLPVQAIVQANQLDLHTQIRVGQRLLKSSSSTCSMAFARTR